MFTLCHWLIYLLICLITLPEQAFLQLTQPSPHSLVLGAVADLTRPRLIESPRMHSSASNSLRCAFSAKSKSLPFLTANAICEHFLGSVRRECLDHLLILGESHLDWVIREYVEFFNQAQPHQGIEQKIPEGIQAEEKAHSTGKIIAFPVLNGPHHDYRRAA